jgi:hypothetical protein
MAGADAKATARRALPQQLGVAPPRGLRELSAEEAEHLADTLQAARRAHAKALEKALNDALKILPGFLRGPVKKAVGA